MSGQIARTWIVRTTVVAGLVALPLLAGAAWSAPEDATLIGIDEFRIDPDAMCQLREKWIDGLLAANAPGTWAPMKFELDDEDLALMGLPPRAVLAAQRYPTPTAVFPDGSTSAVALDPALAAYGGTGCLGIRPGAWLLTITSDSVGWCSMAHVYGAAGSYQISTAGHCGKTNDIATVVAAVGNFNRNAFGITASVPILLDFGRFSKSTGDAGIGKDWALIGVDAPYQGLVSPTMCFWGGPIGMYTKTGATVSATLLGRKLVDGPYVNPDPLLVQAVVHYGHGTGIGAGGTPRAGTTFYWTTNTMIWEGAITPGDSGSGSNTALGDTVGAEREAAGINTHIFVDASLKTGIGYLASTRATLVTANLANGQLVPYPAPVPGAP